MISRSAAAKARNVHVLSRALSSRAASVLNALDIPTAKEVPGVYDGTWTGSGEVLESVCPTTGEVLARVQAVRAAIRRDVWIAHWERCRLRLMSSRRPSRSREKRTSSSGLCRLRVGVRYCGRSERPSLRRCALRCLASAMSLMSWRAERRARRAHLA